MTRGRASDPTVPDSPSASEAPSAPPARKGILRRSAGRLLGSYTGVMALLSLSAVGTALYLSPVSASTRAGHPSLAHEAAATAVEQPTHHTLSSLAPATTIPLTLEKKEPTSTTTVAAHGSSVVHDDQQIIKEEPIDVIVRPNSTSGSGSSEVASTPVAAPTTAAPTTTVAKAPTTTASPTTTTPKAKAAVELVPTKAELLDPTSDYWGVAITGVPQGTSQLNALDAEVGQAPSVLEWFQGWDEPYDAAAVETSWERGALPIVTWESKPTVDSTPSISDPAYSLTNILAGNFDSYIEAYAQSVVAEGLPVVIRFDQEMNGNWYPWSEGLNDNASGSFVKAWQHVWNIFQAAGANKYVIWLWAVNRVDNLPSSTPPLSHFYPGDQYVDWIGVDAYYRTPDTEQPTFASTFGESLTQLSALSAKPEFIAETGAVETDPTTGASNSANKAAWTTSLFAGLQANPQIVGFSWFDNVATTTTDGVVVDNDWRLDSDPETLLAFKTGLSGGQFSVGLTPVSGQPAPTLEQAATATTTTTSTTIEGASDDDK